MLNCHKATRLMSESQDRPLSLGERLSLGFHTLMCSGCRNCEKQLHFLRRASQHFVKEQHPDRESSDETRAPSERKSQNDEPQK